MGPIGFEKIAVSLLENWWVEMGKKSQEPQLIWGTQCTSDETEFERVLQDAFRLRVDDTSWFIKCLEGRIHKCSFVRLY